MNRTMPRSDAHRYSPEEHDQPVAGNPLHEGPPRQHQGTTKVATGPRVQDEVVTISVNPLQSMTRNEKVDTRILEILEQPSYSRYLGWSVTDLRQRVGGQVRSVEFRTAIQRLLAAGKLVEFWMKSAGPGPTHRLALARYSKFIDPDALIEIRGRREYVDRFDGRASGVEDD